MPFPKERATPESCSPTHHTRQPWLKMAQILTMTLTYTGEWAFLNIWSGRRFWRTWKLVAQDVRLFLVAPNTGTTGLWICFYIAEVSPASCFRKWCLETMAKAATLTREQTEWQLNGHGALSTLVQFLLREFVSRFHKSLRCARKSSFLLQLPDCKGREQQQISFSFSLAMSNTHFFLCSSFSTHRSLAMKNLVLFKATKMYPTAAEVFLFTLLFRKWWHQLLPQQSCVRGDGTGALVAQAAIIRGTLAVPSMRSSSAAKSAF